MTELGVANKPPETLVGDRVDHAEGASVGVHPIVTVIHPPTAAGPRPGTRPARSATMDTRQRLQQVLAGQSFPAERWELIAAAEMYGADLVTRTELQALLPVRYERLADVLLAVEHTPRACRCFKH
jgi:hypothetical protein